MKFLIILSLLFLSFQTEESDEALTKKFESSMGKLSCPLQNSYVDPTKVFINIADNSSTGVDLISSSDSEVKSILEGVVVSSIAYSKNQHSVIVSHGEYFSVYSLLSSSSVSSGDRLEQGAIIGIASVNKDGNNVIHIEIWKGAEKLHPPDWINCSRDN